MRQDVTLRDIAVIAASVGGVKALSELVGCLNGEHAGTLLVVQHVAATCPRLLDQLLTSNGFLALDAGPRSITPVRRPTRCWSQLQDAAALAFLA
ncbi:chemotaxis protein CheB [Caballeronia pedi]|uniref:chemotaxis protein CheB n=1 Tax=Caballeronia pedi TaxID=1777141 RepID=UPI001177A4FC